MSGTLFECGYGAIVLEDVAVLEACLFALQDQFIPGLDHVIRVLEIGMHDGGTARGIENYLKPVSDRIGRNLLRYTGIDPENGSTRPRHIPAGGKVIIGDSAEVFSQVEGPLDLVWVDGCHCMNHVILDVAHYATMIRVGGFILFHDANPTAQGQTHQYHGPDIPEFAVSVTKGLEAIQFPWPNWKLFDKRFPSDKQDCGTLAFQRIA